MFHLCYYIISHRLKILASFIASIATEPKYNIKINICDDAIMSFAGQRIKRLRTTGYLFDRLCEAVNELAATFSLSVLVILSVLMVVSAICLFFCVNSIPFFGENANYSFASICVWSILNVLIVLISAESHVTEVKIIDNYKFIYIFLLIFILKR